MYRIWYVRFFIIKRVKETDAIFKRGWTHMFVKRLTIEHFGRFGYKSVNFCDTLNVIAGEDTRAVFAALNVALCNRLLRLQVSPYCISEKSRIYAETDLNGTPCISETTYCADSVDHCKARIYRDGRLLSEEEGNALFRVSLEEEECSFFINRYDYVRYVPFVELDFSNKLEKYRKAMQGEDSQNFAARTDGISLTHTFRRELKRFFRDFLPRQICPEKQLRLILDRDGRFSAEGVRPRRDFNAMEEVLFQFSCFSEVNRFWGMVQKTMGRTLKKPLFITLLMDSLDQSVPLSPFLVRAVPSDRQAFIFTEDKNIEKRLTGSADGINLIRIF